MKKTFTAILSLMILLSFASNVSAFLGANKFEKELEQTKKLIEKKKKEKERLQKEINKKKDKGLQKDS